MLVGVAMLAVAACGWGIAPSSAFTGAWYGPDGEPAERGDGPDRTFEVAARVGPGHCDWESVVFLHVVWPLGTTYKIGPDAPPIHEYVRDPVGDLGHLGEMLGQLDLDAELPDDAQSTGYHTDRAELWFGPDGGDQYAYLDTDRRVERWPRAREPIGCG